ncbi:MAG TPA: S8 family serine peptidase [Jatrophihabitans sp.]
MNRIAAPRTTRWQLGVAASAALLVWAPAPAPVAVAAAPDAAPQSSFAAGKWGDTTADALSKDAYGDNAASKDPGSLFTVEKATNVRDVWGKKDKQNRQVTGQGVAVALLDSGVSPVPGLDAPGKVVYGPDLSVEGNGVLADQDSYGHGTFMAGLIAGRGATKPSSDLPSAPAGVQLGVAPDATLLSVKLATADGGTDVTQVIAGIDWVVEHPVLPNGTRVRVINLSYGTDSAQGYSVDPLAAAAENAWNHGIVVVTSAGNGGSASGELTDPAYDPYVIAVGAADSSDRTDGWAHDHTKAASFSQVSTDRHADLVAPGTSLVSLRDPGSTVDQNNPQGQVSGDVSGKLFRGSGTSQAAAVVSGAVADLLQAFPSLTPDQVKYALTEGADQINNASPTAVGAGVLDLNGAYGVAQHLVGTDSTAAQFRAAAVQNFAHSTGVGSIDIARGGSVLVDADGNPITGEVDAQGNPWDAEAWRAASTSLTAWDGGAWLGATWTGDGWSSDTSLTSARWTSARWTSARWTSADWSSARWTSARWTSARWTAARWSSARWTSARWTGAGW